MKRLLFILILFPAFTFAQQEDTKKKNPNPSKTWFGMSGFEFIFSAGKINDPSTNPENVLRFSGFFNYQHQSHYDFSAHAGIYTGLGIRNIGLINRINVPSHGKVTLKQRSYSVGLPLAIKFGNMERGNYIALGIEEELMFNYKRKIMYNDNKDKFSEWFSPDVKMFVPSAFIDIRRHDGTYLRFRYYLSDFLVSKTDVFMVPGTQTAFSYTPLKSSMFYISIGAAIKEKKKRKAKADEV